MRIGILGGTLDPIHNGHIVITRLVKEALDLDEMLLLPAGDPPHKTTRVDKWHRLKMVKLAAKEAGFRVSDTEIRREKTTYTIDTLTEFRLSHPDDELWYVVGGDTVFYMETWKSFPRVAALTNFAVVARPGDSALEEKLAHIAASTGAVLKMIPGEGPDISSTQIREFAEKGASLKGLVPASVERYILENDLYRDLSIEEMQKKLEMLLPEKRFRHSIGVMETAVRLAAVAGADAGKARVAGLLHDCAKKLSCEEMLANCQKSGTEVLQDELMNEAVLHAPAGVYTARHEFGVNDPEILNAIRLHTVGAPAMTPLEALIYVADFIEPNRKPIPGLEEIRAAAEKDIYLAAVMCGSSTERYVTSRGLPFCEQTRQMLQYYRYLEEQT